MATDCFLSFFYILICENPSYLCHLCAFPYFDTPPPCLLPPANACHFPRLFVPLQPNQTTTAAMKRTILLPLLLLLALSGLRGQTVSPADSLLTARLDSADGPPRLAGAGPLAHGRQCRHLHVRPHRRTAALQLPGRQAVAPGLHHEAPHHHHRPGAAPRRRAFPHRGVVPGHRQGRHAARRPVRGGWLRPRVRRRRARLAGALRGAPALFRHSWRGVWRRVHEGFALLGQRLAVGRQSRLVPALPLAPDALQGRGDGLRPACRTGHGGAGKVQPAVVVLPRAKQYPQPHPLGRALPRDPQLAGERQRPALDRQRGGPHGQQAEPGFLARLLHAHLRRTPATARDALHTAAVR